MNAAIYGGGLLANPHRPNASYAYRPAASPLRHAATQMERVCQRHGTTLPVAALNFSLRDSRVTSTVVGFTKPATMASTLSAVDADLDPTLWAELDALAPSPDHWLDHERPADRAQH